MLGVTSRASSTHSPRRVPARRPCSTTFPLVVDEVVSKQLFKTHTAELLPGGDYKLAVKSRAGDAGGPLQTSFRKVKYLRVVDPVPLAQTSDGK